MGNGYMGRIAWVDLSTGKTWEERLDEDLAREYVGGYGLGARILFEQQRAGVDPLGPENTLGFTTGPLTGTEAPTGGRYMAVCKSPLTGGWGDANSGGYFGHALKQAGWDAVFVRGIAPAPSYLLITNDQIQVRDATHLWGKDTYETEDALRKELGKSRVRIACIGPASEKLSLISGIVNDKGRIAARSGVGAVMGSKRLKAVAVYGEGRVSVADKPRLDELRKSYIDLLRHSPSPTAKVFLKYGTCGTTAGAIVGGTAPVKNWLQAGPQAFPNYEKLSDDSVIRYQSKKYACFSCPVACGGIVGDLGGPYPVQESHKPEYETLGAFGPLCLNDDLHAIMKLNDVCNRSGLDTISLGGVLAFAMECFEKGILSSDDADGIDLSWGNAPAMIALTDKIVRREGIGDVLADGVKVAAERIGRGSEQYAIHVGGQEPGMHGGLYMPGRGTAYVCDPTPGRHTTGGPLTLVDQNKRLAPYPELQFSGFERYEYKSKGTAGATASCYWQVGVCAGLCLFPGVFFGDFPILDLINAVTGWSLDVAKAVEIGARIQTVRQCFNIREGIEPSKIHLPDRMAGIPPHTEGPLAGVTLDMTSLVYEHRKALGWDPETGCPTEAALGRLGLQKLVTKDTMFK